MLEAINLAEVGGKKAPNGGIYNPEPDSASCPAWSFAHARWLIDLELIIQYSLHYKSLSKNAKSKNAFIFMWEIKHFRVTHHHHNDTPRGGINKHLSRSKYHWLRLLLLNVPFWKSSQLRPGKGFIPDQLVFALHLIMWVWLFLNWWKMLLPEAHKRQL